MAKINISPIHFIDNHTNLDFGLEFKILLLVSEIRPISGKQISFKPQILHSCLPFCSDCVWPLRGSGWKKKIDDGYKEIFVTIIAYILPGYYRVISLRRG